MSDALLSGTRMPDHFLFALRCPTVAFTLVRMAVGSGTATLFERYPRRLSAVLAFDVGVCLQSWVLYRIHAGSCMHGC